MKLNPPNWQKNARLTTRGWVHPSRNELLVARKTSQAEVDEYYNTSVVITKEEKPVEVVVEKPKKVKRSKKVQEAVEKALEEATETVE